MSLLKGNQIETFVRKPSGEISCALIHGADSGAVRETAVAIVKSAAGSLDDPFTVAHLGESDLAADPARLADEFYSIGLFAGRKVIWIGDVGTAFQSQLEPLLAQRPSGNLIVAESESLKKSSRLRILCEESTAAAVIALYDDTEASLQRLIAGELTAAGLRAAPEARAYLIDCLGGGRADARQQLGKLVTYCHGQTEVLLADVEACCADVSQIWPDVLTDAALAGDLEEAERQFVRLIESGVAGTRLLSAAMFQLAQLQNFQLEVARGKPIASAIKSGRPPVPFMRAGVVTAQLQFWNLEALTEVMVSLSTAIRQCRDYAALEDEIASRTFLSVARMARARRAG